MCCATMVVYAAKRRSPLGRSPGKRLSWRFHMRRIVGPAVAAACITYLIAPAVAAELTGSEIKQFLSGKTVYLELTATSSGGAGQGVIYYAADGTALYK